MVAVVAVLVWCRSGERAVRIDPDLLEAGTQDLAELASQGRAGPAQVVVESIAYRPGEAELDVDVRPHPLIVGGVGHVDPPLHSGARPSPAARGPSSASGCRQWRRMAAQPASR